MHAATCPGEYYGNDFMPAHIAQAREFMAASGVNASLMEDSFEELAQRNDIPEFDVISMQGVWSWTSQRNREVIVDLIRRKLVAGGVVCLGYNCNPGWSLIQPLAHLLKLHTERSAGRNDIAERMKDAIAFVTRLFESGAFFSQTNPGVIDCLRQIGGSDISYLAHEYLVDGWRAFSFSETAAMMSEAKLDFAGSANLLDEVDSLLLPEQMKRILLDIDDTCLYETTRDYLVNQMFRMDIYVKGERFLLPSELDDAYRDTYFTLLKLPDHIPYNYGLGRIQVQLVPDQIRPLIACLTADGGRPKSFAELRAIDPWTSAAPQELMQILVLLSGSGFISPAKSPEASSRSRGACERFNEYLLGRAKFDDRVGWLASPITGGGIDVSQTEQLFLLALKSLPEEPDAMAGFVAQVRAQSRGVPSLDEGEIAQLTAEAQVFLSQRLEILRMIGVCP